MADLDVKLVTPLSGTIVGPPATLGRSGLPDSTARARCNFRMLPGGPALADLPPWPLKPPWEEPMDACKVARCPFRLLSSSAAPAPPTMPPPAVVARLCRTGRNALMLRNECPLSGATVEASLPTGSRPAPTSVALAPMSFGVGSSAPLAGGFKGGSSPATAKLSSQGVRSSPVSPCLMPAQMFVFLCPR